jgi:hypothetical protein
MIGLGGLLFVAHTFSNSSYSALMALGKLELWKTDSSWM